MSLASGSPAARQHGRNGTALSRRLGALRLAGPLGVLAPPPAAPARQAPESTWPLCALENVREGPPSPRQARQAKRGKRAAGRRNRARRRDGQVGRGRPALDRRGAAGQHQRQQLALVRNNSGAAAPSPAHRTAQRTRAATTATTAPGGWVAGRKRTASHGQSSTCAANSRVSQLRRPTALPSPSARSTASRATSPSATARARFTTSTTSQSRWHGQVGLPRRDVCVCGGGSGAMGGPRGRNDILLARCVMPPCVRRSHDCLGAGPRDDGTDATGHTADSSVTAQGTVHVRNVTQDETVDEYDVRGTGPAHRHGPSAWLTWTRARGGRGA